MTETQETWHSRVTDWRASGKSAAEFSARQGFAASTLRWWSSRLRREAPIPSAPEPTAMAAAAVVAVPIVRLAKVVKSTAPAVAAVTAPQRGGVIIELIDARVRVVVEAGVDRETLATVLDLVGKGGAR